MEIPESCCVFGIGRLHPVGSCALINFLDSAALSNSSGNP
jgi:hypothetical protein